MASFSFIFSIFKQRYNCARIWTHNLSIIMSLLLSKHLTRAPDQVKCYLIIFSIKIKKTPTYLPRTPFFILFLSLSVLLGTYHLPFISTNVFVYLDCMYALFVCMDCLFCLYVFMLCLYVWFVYVLYVWFVYVLYVWFVYVLFVWLVLYRYFVLYVFMYFISTPPPIKCFISLFNLESGFFQFGENLFLVH